jgi:hypothetical protein
MSLVNYSDSSDSEDPENPGNCEKYQIETKPKKPKLELPDFFKSAKENHQEHENPEL